MISDAEFVQLCNRQAASYARWRRCPTEPNAAAMWEAIRAVRESLRPDAEPVETV